jgi:toxin ParE1/3/4
MEEIRPLDLSITRRAFAHLSAIQAYIAKDRPGVAHKVGKRLRDSFDFLCRFPNLGRDGTKKDTREWPVPGLPYLIVFEVWRDTLIIHGVYHAARQNRTD